MAQYEKIEDDLCSLSSVNISDTPAAPEGPKPKPYYKEEHLEVDLYQRDSDLHHRRLTCTKNPGHKGFLPIKEVTLDDFPEPIRHQEVLDYVKALSKLVVRVKCRRTSHSRPKDDPFQTFAGRGICRSATGCVAKEVEFTNIREFPCLDDNCLQGCDHNVFGFVDIQTNRHVVYDVIEARETEVEFFYDSDNAMSICCMQGYDLRKDDTDEECIQIRCVTHDVDFIHKMNRLVDQAHVAGGAIPRTVRDQSMIDYALILSHPHGSPKSLSIGSMVAYRKVPDNAGALKRFFRQLSGKRKLKLRVTTYMTATCPGCTGAPVVTGFEDGWGWWMLTHHTSDHHTRVSMAFSTPP